MWLFMQTPKLNEVKQQAGFSLEDINIEGFAPMPSPAEIKKMAPLTEAAAENVNKSRNQIKQILTGEDDRLMVITGPCSIHDPKAALDYAQRLAELSEHISETIFPVMRVYFEKPRTVVGWKGYINDPDMNNSFNMAKGMLKARELMIKINEMGLAVATEALDPFGPQYLGELVSWYAIGARTTESQTHREMASGLSAPVGFKNGTDGLLDSSINAVKASRQSHYFLGIYENGQSSIVKTKGNRYSHLVLRGGGGRPNFDTVSVMLAEKALKPIIPAGDGFPFTVRVVAETLESNGSSSMAAVCGGCLSLMDAGVPISDPVAGVAMGLIKEGDNFIVLTDILGDEDALGDMDFKIAGTAEGVTAVQMDIKITGLTTEIMRKAMRQAHEARLHILGEMKKAIDGPRAELSKYAPQHAEVFVNPEVIRMIIGPGGKNIKAITAATGASVDIEDSGRISIFAPTAESMEQAKELVQYYDQRPDLGKNYMGKVRKVLEIGAIVEIMPNVEALVHISQLDTSRVAQASDVAHLGEDMLVKVIEINGDRIRASRKAVLLEEQGIEWKPEDTARPARAPRGEGDRDHRGDRGDRGERRERRPRRD